MVRPKSVEIVDSGTYCNALRATGSLSIELRKLHHFCCFQEWFQCSYFIKVFVNKLLADVPSSYNARWIFNTSLCLWQNSCLNPACKFQCLLIFEAKWQLHDFFKHKTRENIFQMFVSKLINYVIFDEKTLLSCSFQKCFFSFQPRCIKFAGCLYLHFFQQRNKNN